MFALAIVAAFGVLAVATGLSGRVDLREGSDAEDGPPVEIKRVLDTYRIVYRVETGKGDTRNVATEHIEVRRPFESRVEDFSDPPPGSRSVAVRSSTAGRLETGDVSLVVPISLAASDLRFDPVLQPAVDESLIQRRERRRVFGRSCQVYRAKAPVTAGDLTPLPARDHEREPTEYVDFCIDEAGLLVEEFWVRGGDVLRRRAAVEVLEQPELGDDRFPEFREGGGPQGGVIGVVEPHDESWVIVPPDGFERTGTFVVGAPDLSGPDAPLPFEVAPPHMQTDVYTHGHDVIVLDQDPSLEILVGRTGDRYVTRAAIEGFGEAEVVWDFRASEVRLPTPDSSFVRISGTLSPDELVALAGTLHQPGSSG